MTTETQMTQRNWTDVGADLVERVGGEENVVEQIDALEWQQIPKNGETLTVGFMPGEAIKAAILELQLPKVSAVAIGSFECPDTGGHDGFYPGFYGIEANYANGRARIYILDTGTSVTPLVSDFWEAE